MLRAGRTRRLLGGWLPAPSTLGTFLRAFTFGHVRQLDRLLAETLTRAWRAGAGPGEERLVVDVDSFIGEVHGYQKQGAGFGYTKQRGYHPLIASRADTGEVLHVRLRKGKANSSRGVLRFAEELIARVARAGASGEKLLRADSAFWNNTLMKRLAEGRLAVLDQHPRAERRRRADRRDPRVRLADARRLPRGRGGADRRDDLRRQADDRPTHPPDRRASRAVARLAPLPVPHQPHRGDQRSSRPSTASTPSSSSRSATSKTKRFAHFPSGQFDANSAWTVIAAIAHNLTRWTTVIGLPGQTVRAARTLRRRLLQIPGRLTRTARQWTLHLPARWPWQHDFIRALARIRALPAARSDRRPPRR